MSMFMCARCDRLRDSDDGCEEAPASKYGRAHQLLCIDCMEEDDPAAAYANAAHPLKRHDRPFTAEQQRIIDAHMAEDDGEGP